MVPFSLFSKKINKSLGCPNSKENYGLQTPNFMVIGNYKADKTYGSACCLLPSQDNKISDSSTSTKASAVGKVH